MSQLNVNVIKDVTGLKDPAIIGCAKATFKADIVSAVLTIKQSYGVASITRLGLGDFSVVFSTAFPDADYTCALSVRNPSGGDNSLNLLQVRDTTGATTTSVRCICVQSGFGVIDPQSIYGAFFHN